MGFTQILRKPWSAEDVVQLRKLVRQNIPSQVIARKLGRSMNAFYVNTWLRPETPRSAISFNCSTSRFPLQAEARMIWAKFFFRTGT